MAKASWKPFPDGVLRAAYLEAGTVLDPYARGLHQNMARIRRMLAAAEILAASDLSADNDVANDVLRSVVVFLHATLEDALRSVAALYLPLSDEDALNSIPLVGTGTAGRAEKFFLGKLAQFRGKSVDEVISASVAAHLARSNYNDTTEVAYLLEALRIDVRGISKHFASLSALMQRRHEIVHRADVCIGPDTEPGCIRPIDRQEIEAWGKAVQEVTTYIMAHIIGTEMHARVPALRELEDEVRRLRKHVEGTEK